MNLSNDNTPPRSFVQRLTYSKQYVTNTFLLVASMATLVLFSGPVMAQGLWQANGPDEVYTSREFVGINIDDPDKALHIVTTHTTGQASHEGIRLTNKIFPLPPTNGALDTSTWDIEPQFANGSEILQFGQPSKFIMALADTGNVGIGTKTPDQPLHIAGVEAPIIKLQDDQGALHQSWLIGEGVHGGGDLGFKEVDNNTGDNVLFDISGNLGIGTTNPDDKLDVNGAARIGSDNWNCVLCGEGDIQDGSPLDGKGFVATPWVYARAIEGNRRGSGATLITLGRGAGKPSTDRDHIGFFTRGNNRLMVYPDGDVGIGTGSGGTDGFKFAVCGQIKSDDITVENTGDWCDYVFDKDYQPMSLQTKTSYIDSAHHLPYMPSANKVNSEGLKVGDAMVGLTRNVEENTRHLEKTHHKTTQLVKRVKRQEKQIQLLKKQIKKLKDKCNDEKKGFSTK